jgi:hypothetical protein
MSFWLLAFAVVATLAIFATTTRGREIAKRLGFRDRVKGAAPSADVAFLLEACGGDAQEVALRLDVERARFPDLTEAEHYRRAIRKAMAERGSTENGEV